MYTEIDPALLEATRILLYKMERIVDEIITALIPLDCMDDEEIRLFKNELRLARLRVADALTVAR